MSHINLNNRLGENMKIVLVLLFAISAIESRSTGGNRCEISIDHLKGDLKEPQPLILTDTEKPTFVLPNDRKILVFPTNTSILLVCPGKQNYLQNIGSKSFVRAVCLNRKQFIVESKVYEFNTFKCKVFPKETIRKSKSTCLGSHQRYDIGFSFKNKFVPLLEICRNDKSYETYYTKETIVKEILGFQNRFPRPYWKYGSYYSGYNMNEIYKANSQIHSMKILLGSEELARKYINSGEKRFFNRGHLAAKADFIYGAQQTATFWLLNTAPQWGPFNSGNWMIAEYNVRDFAASRRMDLVVYTGVHGVTSLPDINGVEQPLYLHVNETHKAIPVPEFYWKIIHDPISNTATALVGLNKPDVKNITDDMYLCPDIRQEIDIPWLTWNASNTEKGLIYVCSVEELRKSVPTIPYFEEAGLLI